MDLVDFENKIKTQLEDNLTGNKPEVKSFPDDPDNYISQLTNRNGAILVAFQGANWEPPVANSESILTQNSTYNWQFTVLQKSMQWTNNQYGIYALLEEIRTILSGFTPDGFDDSTILWPVDSGFLSKTTAFYVYQITFSHQIEESET